MRAVKVQTTKVSANTSKIPHMPCTTGSFTLEAECTITEDPSPASLENTPREIPLLIATITVKPVIPPPMEEKRKAFVKMAPKASGTADTLEKITIREPIIYVTAIKGTSFSVTEAIRLMPPTITSPARSMTIRAVAHFGTEKE